MKRAVWIAKGGRVTFDLIALQKRLKAGVLTAGERRIYRHVFGHDPKELLQEPPTVGGVGGRSASGGDA